MRYFVAYDNENEVYEEEQLRNFINTAVIHNKDIADFHVIALDSRLKDYQALFIGDCIGFYDEVAMGIMNGDSPLVALLEWLDK